MKTGITGGIRLPVPLRFRRGGHRKDPEKSLQSALDLLKWVDGHRPLEGARILDFGCGVKVAQALCQLDSPQAAYAGLDLYAEMIAFISEALRGDDRYAFYTVPFANEMYNPGGEEMHAGSELPLGDQRFDTLLMFSVITHMTPADTAAVLAILRRYASADARMLFWAFADPDQPEDFRDDNPERPLLRAEYNRDYLERLIAGAGWDIVLREPVGRTHRKERYVCSPAP